MSRKPNKSKVPAPTTAAVRAAVPARTNGKVAAAHVPATIAVRLTVEVPDGTPAYYANFIEISHTKWDFSMVVARLPAKHSLAKIAEMQTTGVLAMPAEATINFPPTLMAGLIRALTTTKESYEKETKTELKETDHEPTGQKQKRRSGRRRSAG